MLNDRVWNMVQAALRFWNLVDEVSTQSPLRHPGIRPFFENGRPSPLTRDEVEFVINSDPVANQNLGYPALAIVRHYPGLSRHKLLRSLHRLGCRPTGRAGRTDLWKWYDLHKAASAIQETDKKFLEKYAPSRGESPDVP